MIASRIEYIAHQLTLSAGKGRILYTLALGALAALSQAPFHFYPAMVIAFTGFVWILDGAVSEHARSSAIKTAFGLGWWFGLGYFGAGLYWIGNAFLVEAQEFAILMPFGIIGLCAGLALFWGVAAAIAKIFWTSHSTRVIALAACFSALEFLRGQVLTGFPWNALGYGIAFHDVINQGISIIGIWGYSFFAILIASTPALIVDSHYRILRRALYAIVIIAGLSAICFGIYRLNTIPDETEQVNATSIRIVQPNIDQKLIQRAAPDDRQVQFQTLLDLSAGPYSSANQRPMLIIWPETAYPYLWDRQPDKLVQIQGLLQNKSALVTGVHRAEATGPMGQKIYNSMYGLDSNGTIVTVYDKIHLVPFGEYLPFQRFLESIGLEQITRQSGGFAAGKTRELLNIPGIPPFLPLICYEVIFPSELQLNTARPQFIINITNDGWFGNSTGPFQHLHMARIRSIEEGLPIIRAANTGISAIINAYGQTIHSLKIGSRGVINGELPPAIDNTPYSAYGDLAFFAMLLCSFLIVIIGKKYK